MAANADGPICTVRTSAMEPTLKNPSITSGGRRMLDRYATSGELVVPQGYYFVLGDSRDDSYDSRSWGLLEASQIIGLVHEVLSSEDPTKMPRAGRRHLPIQRGYLT